MKTFICATLCAAIVFLGVAMRGALFDKQYDKAAYHLLIILPDLWIIKNEKGGA